MKDSKLNQAIHPPETLIAAYAIGKCSPEVQADIDEHCFTCEGCRTRLSILLRLSSLGDNEIERRELERLFPLGKETIAQARQPISYFPETPLNDSYLFSSDSAKHINEKNTTRRLAYTSNSSKKSQSKKFYQIAAATLLVLVLSSAGYYWYATSHSPVQNSLLAMQRSYQLSRPLEARLSGGLEYKPYARSRGSLEGTDINRDQLNYALAELTRAVASNPTPQERHALGRLYLFLGEFDKAEAQMKIALDTLKRDAKLHTDLATLYYERSNYADGDPSTLLTQAVAHYDIAIEVDPQSAEAWFNRALCYEKLSLFTKAKEGWTQYLKIDSGSKWAEEARERLKKLDAKANRDNDPKKKENITALLEKALNSKDDEALLSILNQDPAIVTQFAINNLSEQYLVASLSKNQKQAELVHSELKKIGDFFVSNKGDSFIADLAELAARASPKMKSRMLSVHLKLRQADNELSRSSHDTAFKLYQSALLAATNIEDELHAEIAASNLVRYSHNRANSDSLISLGNRFVTQTEKRHHRQLQSQIHTSLANAYLSSQQGTLALENSLRATAIAKEIGDKDAIITGLILAGTAYTRLGNYKLGLSKSFEVISLLTDYPVSQFRRFQAYQQLWEPLFRLGNYQLALDYQKEALHTATLLNYGPGITGTMGRIGLNLWKLNQSEEAENYLKTAVEKSNLITDKTLRQLLQTELFTTLGDVSLSLGKTEDSLANYSFAFQAIKASSNSVYLSAIHQGLASAFLAKNNIPETEHELQLSISLLEKSRQQISDANGRSVFLLRSQNAYMAMVDFQYYTKRNHSLAFDYGEIARNRNVLDALANSGSIKTSDGRILLSLSNNSHPLKLKEVQDKMPGNAQILSYILTEKGLIIWHITSNDYFVTNVKVTPASLTASLNDYLTSLRSRKDIEIINDKSSRLYELLILPIMDHLDSKRPLYIIQDGILSQLPFTTLYCSSTNHYLIEDYSIVTNHSASVLVKTNDWSASKRHINNETFFGVSNPRFSHRRFPGLPPLPSAEEEAFKIGSLYKISKIFNQGDATESNVLQQIPNYNIVHFASHTLGSETDNLASAIILTEENSSNNKNGYKNGFAYDGTLQAIEIYHLNLLETKLVILSSCRSGLGNISNGETIGALAQAFLAIKVPSVIASLWDVDDESSSELMYSFHRNHRLNSLDYANSLREAQCSLLHGSDKSKRHPYYWGAFQILGAGI